MAVEEDEALKLLFSPIHKALKRNDCKRAILVGHNPAFDIAFLNAAIYRTKLNAAHFTLQHFDTATLGGLVYQQTVLAKVIQAAGLDWNEDKAHSALYDAEKTAEVFCKIVNRWKELDTLSPNQWDTLHNLVGLIAYNGASISDFNSPFLNISVTISHPPTNCPLT